MCIGRCGWLGVRLLQETPEELPNTVSWQHAFKFQFLHLPESEHEVLKVDRVVREPASEIECPGPGNRCAIRRCGPKSDLAQIVIDRPSAGIDAIDVDVINDCGREDAINK